MILPKYQEITIKDNSIMTRKIIKFDKLSVGIYGNAKYKIMEMYYFINKGVRRRNIDLNIYINIINDYLISHPTLKKYKNKTINIFDFNYVKCITFKKLKFSSNEFQIIKEKYPNISYVETNNCTIYDKALIGVLNCDYIDNFSHIISLNSFNGFSGSSIRLNNSYIENMNKNILNLNNIHLNLKNININYELFFLTTSAPNLRKIEIYGKKPLKEKDLLFISGFYNLESININSLLPSYQELEKLEKLRELRYVFSLNNLEKVKEKNKKTYEKLKNSIKEKYLQNYLMGEKLFLQNRLQDLRYKLYVPRLERIKWEKNINTKNLLEIKKELISINKMFIEDKINISREIKKEYTFFESIHGLDFNHDYHNEEDVLINSRPFQSNGIDYYVKRKKLILDKYYKF